MNQLYSFLLFQHQPDHRSRGGADAKPHRRDDGGAEGV